jgi:hypothetical protein
MFMLLPFFLLSASCEKKESPKDVILLAYQLIDLNKPDQAIVLLETELKTNPRHQKARIVLASAYAFKAGVTMKDVLAAYNQSYFKNRRFQGFFLTNENEKVGMERFLIELLKIADVFGDIPAVSAGKYDYLQEGISILNQSDRLSRADFLYSAILRVIELKSWMLIELRNVNFMDAQSQCHLDYQKLMSFVSQMTEKLMLLLSDLSVAQPERRDEFIQSRTAVFKAYSNLTTMIDSNTIENGQNMGAFNALMLQLGLGVLIRCSADGKIQ